MRGPVAAIANAAPDAMREPTCTNLHLARIRRVHEPLDEHVRDTVGDKRIFFHFSHA